MKYKIAVSGSYGGMNAGDEAILESILKQLRASLDAEIVVFSRNPKDTEQRHKVRALPIREMDKDAILNELKSLDLFILGGGGILFDGYVEGFLRDVRWAKELGIPVFVYAVSIGPLKKAENKQMVVEVLNTVDRITVREGEAKRMMHEMGIELDIEVTSDPALLMQEESWTLEALKAQGINSEIPLVGFSLREPGDAAPELNIDQYHAVLANAADFMVERFGAQILFVPMERGENKDIQHSHAVISRMSSAHRASVLSGDYTSGQILGLVGRMAFAVGMRLHFLIFAGIQKVPFVPLPYASKVSGFLSDLEMPMPAITKMNTGKLCALIDRSWDRRDRIKKQLEEKVPQLQERAKLTNTLLWDFLKSLKPKPLDL